MAARHVSELTTADRRRQHAHQPLLPDPAPLPHPPAAHRGRASNSLAAADAAGGTRTRWLGIAHALDQVTVTARGGVSAVANGLDIGAVSRRQAMRVAVGRRYQVLVHLFPARGRRSSSLMPPRTPYSCLVSSANARHCRRTAQPAQITFACVTWSREGPDPETGKNSSGSACRHAASSRQSRPGIVIIPALSGLGEIVILGRKSLGGR